MLERTRLAIAAFVVAKLARAYERIECLDRIGVARVVVMRDAQIETAPSLTASAALLQQRDRLVVIALDAVAVEVAEAEIPARFVVAKVARLLEVQRAARVVDYQPLCTV